MRSVRGLVLVWLTACGAPPAADVGVSREPIIGGMADSGDPAVVLVLGTVKNGAHVSGFICTGSVIAPRLVLTAAHCIDPEMVGDVTTWRIFLGDNYNDSTERVSENYVQVQEGHSHPDFNILKYQQNTNTADIGVLMTKEDITKGGKPIPPLPINRKALDKGFIGLPTRLVGYGLDGRDGKGTSGAKRQTMTTVSDWDFITLYFKDPAHITCSGDSGGPALVTIDGQEVVAGVTSGGDVGCNQYGFHTRVDSYAEQFIVPYMEGRTPVFPDMAHPVDAAASGGEKDMGGCSATGADGGGAATAIAAAVLALILASRRQRSRTPRRR